MDGDGIPLAFSLFPGNTNEQKSLKPLEQKVIGEFGCRKFIYCSDAGLASENICTYNHMGERAFIVTQSIKKLPAEDKTWALDKSGFRRVSDDRPIDITALPDDDANLYYKDEPYTPKKLHQRLLITYSPKYARYQKAICEKQAERAEKMIASGNAGSSAKIQMIRQGLLVLLLLQMMVRKRNYILFLMKARSQMKHCTMVCMPYVQIYLTMMRVRSSKSARDDGRSRNASGS